MTEPQRAEPPAKRPCGSCPYRRDVPSGVWHPTEYERLTYYDAPTGEQPPGVFLCHQQDGRICAGWAGCHDMNETLAVRIAAISGTLTPEAIEALLDYETDIPLFDSGADACEHGLADVETPSLQAERLIDRLSDRIDSPRNPQN